MSAPFIRPIAICLFSHQGKILVFEGHDPLKQETFYRPLGGGIEFGETASETIHREMMEELGQRVTDLQYLATVENIFVHMGNPGHEIVMIFDGRFVDNDIYRLESIVYNEQEDVYKPPQMVTCRWRSIDWFLEGNGPLYPDGLLDLLEHYEQ